ncbi:hypothetical protein [Natrononativus amylolyticus]|uniref:hypothetical protein n=1 Tax=Natrononativus amylolyticus TaxID=2963434 RepID=UPI0020CCEDB4|nr:hypothetical protein [Natrononativus amylolyticus]
MSDEESADQTEKAINIEVPEGDKTRYISVEMPLEQYESLDKLKDEFGMTWRGLLIHSRRQLDGVPQPGSDEAETSQYELLNETRQRHGFTWKGMLLFAERHLRSDNS